jgi:hypothetical protein
MFAIDEAVVIKFCRHYPSHMCAIKFVGVVVFEKKVVKRES